MFMREIWSIQTQLIFYKFYDPQYGEICAKYVNLSLSTFLFQNMFQRAFIHILCLFVSLLIVSGEIWSIQTHMSFCETADCLGWNLEHSETMFS